MYFLKNMAATLSKRIKIIIFGISPKLAERLDVKFEFQSPDRTFLEHQIFGWINEKFGNTASLLFVGIDRYNWHYPRLIKGDFYSIDLNPKNERYGNKSFHKTGSATELSTHYPIAKFDVVICNGLVGYGVNNEQLFSEMIKECDKVLKKNGYLVLGYNNTPERLAFDLTSQSSLSLFKKTIPEIKGVNSSTELVPTKHNHTFMFLQKS